MIKRVKIPTGLSHKNYEKVLKGTSPGKLSFRRRYLSNQGKGLLWYKKSVSKQKVIGALKTLKKGALQGGANKKLFPWKYGRSIAKVESARHKQYVEAKKVAKVEAEKEAKEAGAKKTITRESPSYKFFSDDGKGDKNFLDSLRWGDDKNDDERIIHDPESVIGQVERAQAERDASNAELDQRRDAVLNPKRVAPEKPKLADDPKLPDDMDIG